MSWIGYSLSEQSFLFIESFKSIPGQLQAFGIENNLNSINLHLPVLIKGISTKLWYFQIISVVLNFSLIEKKKKERKKSLLNLKSQGNFLIKEFLFLVMMHDQKILQFLPWAKI